VAERSKQRNVFVQLNTKILSSNPTRGMGVCLLSFCVCVVLCTYQPCDGLTPIQGVLPTLSKIHSFIHQCLYGPMLGPGLFFSLVSFFIQKVGLVGRVISPSQGRCLHTGQHEHRINVYGHSCFEWVSNSRFRDSEDSSCLRLRGRCDRLCKINNFRPNYE
jgi:hypothetical protein